MMAPVAHMNGIKRPPSGPEPETKSSKLSRPTPKAHTNGHIIESIPTQKAMLPTMYSQIMQPMNMMALNMEHQQQLHQQQLHHQQQQQLQQHHLQQQQQQQQRQAQLLANGNQQTPGSYNIQYVNGTVKVPVSTTGQQQPHQSQQQPEQQSQLETNKQVPATTSQFDNKPAPQLFNATSRGLYITTFNTVLF